jgi:hypothetical protein
VELALLRDRLLDTAFAGRLAALAADGWKEVMRRFVTQVASGEAGTRKLIDAGMAAWSQVPMTATAEFVDLVRLLVSTGTI